MKFAVSVFSVLTLVVSGMLFFQYQAYSSDLEAGNGSFYYSQEIDIVYRENSLDIRHHFKNLPNQRVNIEWPENAVDPTCFIDNEKSCNRLSDETSHFKKGETKAQSVSYIIPLKDGLKSKTYLQNIFATLKNGETSYSVVHISTDSKVAGQWVTGLPLVGQQQLSLVNYTMFSGSGRVNDLYWQAGNLKMQKESDVVSIYSQQAVSAKFMEALNKADFLNEEHLSIVQGENPGATSGERILFLPTLDQNAVEQEIIMSQVKSQYKFVDSSSWLPEVVASYLVEQPVGSTKSKEIVSTLDEYMTSDQQLAWEKAISDLTDEPISPKKLDSLLSEVLEQKTSFFEANASWKDGVYPLLFEDGRGIYIDEFNREDVKIILHEGRILYTADTLLPHLGYTAGEGKNGYYVNNDTRTFRFPKEPGFYVLNQRRYDTLSEPIIKIADRYYLEETWLQRLFLVDFQKSDNRVHITTQDQK
ncbi:MAG: RNA polymerase II [Lysinibacillus sp.]